MDSPVQLVQLNCGHATAIEVLEEIQKQLALKDVDVINLQEVWLTPTTAKTFRQQISKHFPHFHLTMDMASPDHGNTTSLAIVTLIRNDLAQHAT